VRLRGASATNVETLELDATTLSISTGDRGPVCFAPSISWAASSSRCVPTVIRGRLAEQANAPVDEVDPQDAFASVCGMSSTKPRY